MFKKILIANRGEIAVRIIRTCREMGIRTVALFSDTDRRAMHVQMADEAFPLGGNTPAESYLRGDRIIEIAKAAHIDAIHPGYGFLSENPVFADNVKISGVHFIGPPASAIRALGDKTSARMSADKLHIPTVPGTHEPIEDAAKADMIARKIGYPVIIKAAAGGGGKGMRIVVRGEDLPRALESAHSEAKSAFGDGRVYIEKYIEAPRHIEIQILSDGFGHTVYLGERECSIQRRHQKVIEETPSPVVDAGLRKRMGEAAVRLVNSSGYVNAGTVEFLIDKKKQFYFLEMNTRLQVEHPVTERVTGIDLVKEQILIASGEHLPFNQEQIEPKGHAIECRICAEDPADSFLPSTGTLVRYSPPQGPRIRVDNGLREGDEVTIYYDPLMAKVIAWGQDRTTAIETMKRALSEFRIEGVKSTIPFCLDVLNNVRFRDGAFSTNYVDTEFNPRRLYNFSPKEEIAAAIASVLLRNGAGSVLQLQNNHLEESISTWKKLRLESYR